MRHPGWYYRLYEDVFAPARQYERDISIVAASTRLRGAIVEEVGAGTGNHVAAILEYHPELVVAIDVDAESASILRQRFACESHVQVAEEDGLRRDAPADVVVCFYCIPQQATTPEEALYQTLTLAARTAGCVGTVHIEYMDVDKHLYANASRPPSLVYQCQDDRLVVSTHMTKVGALIVYTGSLEGESVTYEIEVMRVPMSTIVMQSRALQLCVDSHPLSASGRKQILSFRAADQICRTGQPGT